MLNLSLLTEEELNKLAVAVDHQLTVGAGNETPKIDIPLCNSFIPKPYSYPFKILSSEIPSVEPLQVLNRLYRRRTLL